VDDLRIADDTIVIWTTDNGAEVFAWLDCITKNGWWSNRIFALLPAKPSSEIGCSRSRSFRFASSPSSSILSGAQINYKGLVQDSGGHLPLQELLITNVQSEKQCLYSFNVIQIIHRCA
jgi:hypothetical protein